LVKFLLVIQAVCLQETTLTEGLSGRTDPPAMKDELMGKINPLLPRDDFHEVKLYLHGIGAGG
jgi:hypothetical protein